MPASLPPAHSVDRVAERRVLVLCAVGLGGVLLLAYFRVLLLGDTFAVRDHLTWTLPSRAFLGESLRRGHWPEWWDALRLGTRFAADPNNGVTYPPAWLVAVIDPLVAADLLLLLHIFLAGIGVALFARRLGASGLGTFFGAAALMTSGYVTSMIVNGSMLLSVGWMPLLAWAALGVAQAETAEHLRTRGLILAAVLAGSIASGNPAHVNNAVLAGAVVVLTARRRWAALLVLIGAGGLAALIGAVALLVPVLALPDSARAGGLSLTQSGVWSLHPLRLLELVWPQLLGHGLRPESNLAELWARSGNEVGGNWSGGDYVGVPILFCACLAVVRGTRDLRKLGLLSLVFLGLALGTFTPLYGAYRAIFRFEHVLRYPEKHLAAALVLWCALAAKGLDHLFDPTARRSRLLRVGLAATGGVGAGVATVCLAHGRLLAWIARASQALGRGMDGAAALSAVTEGGLAALGVTALVPLALWLAPHPRWGRWARPGFVGIALVQLVAYDWSMHDLIKRNLIRQAPAILEGLAPGAADNPTRIFRRALDVTPLAFSGDQRAWHGHQLAGENEATRFGFAQVPGYCISGTARFDAWATASGRAPLERTLDLLDVRYLIIHVGQAAAMGMPVRSPGMLLGHVVLENVERRPRAFVAYRWRHGLSDDQILDQLFVPNRAQLDLGAVRLSGPGDDAQAGDDSPTPCAIERPFPERVVLHCRASRPGQVVLLDEWMDGWTATVDATAVPVERADALFRSVPVAAGEHRVEMYYRTPGLRQGMLVSLGGTILFLAMALANRRARRAVIRPAGGTPRNDENRR